LLIKKKKSIIEALSCNINIQIFFQGKVEVTIAGGRVVWENNELKVAHGTGRYIKMPPFSYLSDGIDKKGCLLSKLPPSPSGESQIQHLKSF